MITSFVDGRVRFRDEALKNPETAESVLGMLNGVEGVVSAISNLRTGSMLVYYDSEVIDRETLKQAAAAFEEHFGTAAKSDGSETGEDCKCKWVLPAWLCGRRGEANLLGGALSATVLALLAGRRAHVCVGGLFCLLSLKHIYDRRKQMF